MGFPLRFLSSLSLCLLALLLHRATVTSGCFSLEREALLDFKAGIHDTHNRLSSWVGQDCCAWAGVICRATTGHVVKLDLRNTNTLDGALRGERMNSSLLALSHLRHLDLSFNDFSGIRIPEFIGSFKKLRYLNLSSTYFMGGIPARLGNLSSLYVLDLSDALFVDDYGDGYPVDNLDWLSYLRSLKYLNLSGLNLTDVPDWFSSVNMLPSLQVLRMSSVGLNTIPASVVHVNFTSSLTVLDLSYNNFNSTLPKWLWNITSLTHLDLYNSGFHGVIPWFWNISSSTITYLDLSNNQIGGKLPSSFKFTKLETLYLDSNRFEGSLPTMLPSTLDILSLFNNSFKGQLPIWPHVRLVIISDNMLDGGLSSSICQWTHLEYLDLANNKLLGEIPYCLGESLQNLQFLNLANNHFSGEIPHTIGFLRKLLLLQLQNNSFSGEVPLSLKKCTNLWYLDLAQNNLVGNITLWMGENLQPVVLRLRSNMFSGVIPWQLAQFEQLQILDLANNYFSGSIPHNIGNLSTMRSTSNLFVPYEYHDCELDIFTKGQNLHYLTCSIKLMKSLDLSNNSLTGEIPKGIGDLAELNNLNLSRNHLQGKIPREIGGMKSLESLDLSINDLSGSIPESLSALYFLSYLNLSYNNLSGLIPSGHQLQTLDDPSIYMGNTDLCGPPTFKSCSNNKTTDIQEYEKEISDWLWFYISMVLGFVMGFWIFCGILFLKDAWRHAYFHFIDDVYDWVWVQWKLILPRLLRRES